MDIVVEYKTIEEIKPKVNGVGNVGIFVDFDNVYHSLRDFGIGFEDLKYNLFDFIWELYNKENVRTLRAYADYDQLDNIKLRNLQIKRVQVKQVYGNGQGEKHRKNASDIELSVDAVESLYVEGSNIDTYVFITADSDMIPIMSRMIYKGKNVHLYYMSTNTSQYQDITDYAHFSQDLNKIFTFDLNRNSPEYWVDFMKSHIRGWYSDHRNKSKLYGLKWILDDLKKLKLSYKLITSIIKYMEEDGSLVKLAIQGIDGYVVSEDIEGIKSRFTVKQKSLK